MAHDSHSVLTRFLIAFWLTSVLCNFSNTNNMNNVGRKRGRRRKITIIFCVRLSRRIIDYWKNWIKPLWLPAYELPSGLRLEVHVCTARPRSRGTWFAERFWHPKIHNLTFEKKYYFLELFCLLIIEFFIKKTLFWRKNFS